MSNLIPCPGCNRHVLSREIVCPFCSADLPESIPLQARSTRPFKRLSRAALFTAGAAFIGVEACTNVMPVYGAPSGEGGRNPTADGGGGAGGGSSGNDSAVANQGASAAPLEAASDDESAQRD
jgi:hypothetical protein